MSMKVSAQFCGIMTQVWQKQSFTHVCALQVGSNLQNKASQISDKVCSTPVDTLTCDWCSLCIKLTKLSKVASFGAISRLVFGTAWQTSSKCSCIILSLWPQSHCIALCKGQCAKCVSSLVVCKSVSRSDMLCDGPAVWVALKMIVNTVVNKLTLLCVAGG